MPLLKNSVSIPDLPWSRVPWTSGRTLPLCSKAEYALVPNFQLTATQLHLNITLFLLQIHNPTPYLQWLTARLPHRGSKPQCDYLIPEGSQDPLHLHLVASPTLVCSLPFPSPSAPVKKLFLKPKFPSKVFSMSHSQIHAPKHYFEQVIQALKKKNIYRSGNAANTNLFWWAWTSSKHLPQEVSRHKEAQDQGLWISRR